MLTASIMYWSLQQSADDSESSPSSVAVTPEASPAPSVNGDETVNGDEAVNGNEGSEISNGAEISNLSIDDADAASDTTTVSSTHENNDTISQ